MSDSVRNTMQLRVSRKSHHNLTEKPAGLVGSVTMFVGRVTIKSPCLSPLIESPCVV